MSLRDGDPHDTAGKGISGKIVLGLLYSRRRRTCSSSGHWAGIGAAVRAIIVSRKKLIMLGMIVGSLAGGYLPELFGQDGLMLSILGSSIGGILGIWIGFKFSA